MKKEIIWHLENGYFRLDTYCTVSLNNDYSAMPVSFRLSTNDEGDNMAPGKWAFQGIISDCWYHFN